MTLKTRKLGIACLTSVQMCKKRIRDNGACPGGMGSDSLLQLSRTDHETFLVLGMFARRVQGAWDGCFALIPLKALYIIIKILINYYYISHDYSIEILPLLFPFHRTMQ